MSMIVIANSSETNLLIMCTFFVVEQYKLIFKKFIHEIYKELFEVYSLTEVS